MIKVRNWNKLESH